MGVDVLEQDLLRPAVGRRGEGHSGWDRVERGGNASPRKHYLSVEVEHLGCPGLSAAVFTRPSVIVQDVLRATHRCAAGEVELILNEKADAAR